MSFCHYQLRSASLHWFALLVWDTWHPDLVSSVTKQHGCCCTWLVCFVCKIFGETICCCGCYRRWRFLEEQQLLCAGLLCWLCTKNLGFLGDNIAGSVIIHLGNLTRFVLSSQYLKPLVLEWSIIFKKNPTNQIQKPKTISTVASGEEHLENVKPYRLKHMCQKRGKLVCTAGLTC